MSEPVVGVIEMRAGFVFWIIQCSSSSSSSSSSASLPSFLLTPSATEAAGGRWWVSCSLATPAVDGDWYAALFECLPFSAALRKRGTPEQSGPYWILSSSSYSSFSQPGRDDVGGEIFQLKGAETWSFSSGPQSVTQGPPGVPSQGRVQL